MIRSRAFTYSASFCWKPPRINYGKLFKRKSDTDLRCQLISRCFLSPRPLRLILLLSDFITAFRTAEDSDRGRRSSSRSGWSHGRRGNQVWAANEHALQWLIIKPTTKTKILEFGFFLASDSLFLARLLIRLGSLEYSYLSESHSFNTRGTFPAIL